MSDDATIVRFELDPANPPESDWRAFDAMTEEERHAGALSDPDAQPATEETLARMRRVSESKAIRRRLNLTQEQFAQRFHLPLTTIRNWERGIEVPDEAARVLLRVIAFNPEVVEQALLLE